MNSSYKYALLGTIAICVVIVAVATLNYQPQGSDTVDESSSLETTTEQQLNGASTARRDNAAPTPSSRLSDRVKQFKAAQQEGNTSAPAPVDIADAGPKSPAKMVSNQPEDEPAPRIRTFGAPPPSLSKTIKPLVGPALPRASAPPAVVDRAVSNKLESSQYSIMPGDTFSSLAIRYYGHEKYWQAIKRANPTVNPRKLKVGQIIKLPDPKLVVDAEQESPHALGAGTNLHIVAAGETLSTISRKHYGSVKHWRVIFNANREVIGSNPDRLSVGDKLQIPPARIVGKTSQR